MLITVAENTTLLAPFGAMTVVLSPEYDLAQNTRAALTVVVDSIFALPPGAAYAFTVQVQGSNDGRNWFDVSGFLVTPAGTGVFPATSAFPYANIRLKYSLDALPAAGNWACVTFDAKLNLLPQ